MTSQGDILTIPDVARLFRAVENAVYGLALRGDLPAFKVGGQWGFRRMASESWIDVKIQAAGGPLLGNCPKPLRSSREN